MKGNACFKVCSLLGAHVASILHEYSNTYYINRLRGREREKGVQDQGEGRAGSQAIGYCQDYYEETAGV